jgi:hypothetical protein
MAAMCGQLAAMKWLAKQDGIDMAATSKISDSSTALHLAVMYGQLDIVDWMIQTLVVDARMMDAFAGTVHHTPYTCMQVQYTTHHTPYTTHHTPYTTHHTPYTMHHTPHTIHHTPY